ncbi:MAG TPA: periplasmic heavy metal sensor [Pseudomonadales bacterium]
MTSPRTYTALLLLFLSIPLAAAEPDRSDPPDRHNRVFMRHAPPIAYSMATVPLATWGPGTMMATPALMGRLFPPTLIMQRQQELGLTEQQEETIKAELREFQSRVVDVQWDLQSNQGELEAILAEDRIDPDAARAAIDKVLNAENTLKKMHLMLLVRIRNALTPEQIDKLGERFGRFDALVTPGEPLTVP